MDKIILKCSYHKLLLFILLLYSCSKPDKICKRRAEDPDRECTKEELAFISSWNDTIKKINDFDISNFEKVFLSYPQGDGKQPHVALLGEAHDDIKGMVENWGYLNYLARNGRVNVLEEGVDFEEKKDINGFSQISRLIVLLLQKELADEGMPYEPDRWDKVAVSRYRMAVEYFYSSIKHLSVPRYLKNLEFSYWDQRSHKKETRYTYTEFIDRNNSLSKAITYRLNHEPNVPVVVVAGFVHLPLGEYYSISKLIPSQNLKLPPDFASYYDQADHLRQNLLKKGTLNYYEEWLGTTKNIYQALSGMNKVLQAIPRSALDRI